MIKSVLARCIHCKREVKPEQTRCACGDPVRIMKEEDRLDRPHPHARIELLPGTPPITPVVSAGRTSRPDRVPEDLRSDVGTGVQLSEEQRNAISKVVDWYGCGRSQGSSVPFRLFGPAGTGKTTIVKHIAGALGVRHVAYGTYTGKAAHVLRRKGVPATTIHSAIYCPVDDKEARAELAAAQLDLFELRNSGLGVFEPQAKVREQALLIEIENLEQALRHGVQFELNPMSEWADADLIVLDEVSMVNEKIALDIESFGVPVLVLGDPAQLPPVEGGGHYTNHRPDALLTEVHRQALESPVLALATHVRTGGSWKDRLVKVNLDEAMAADQILCWKNATRHALTAKIREKKGRPAGVPVPGDRVMCLVNNKDIGVFNGQQFEVLNTFDNGQRLSLRDDDGVVREIECDPDGFRGQGGETEAESRSRFRGKVGLFTFAEVITVHKSQGSEWDHVYVVDQTHQMSRETEAGKRRWAYTALTRASEKVTIASTEVR